MDLLLAHGEPAGGAALNEILWASGVALVLFAALGVFGVLHRSGRTNVLTNVGSFSSRVSGLPAWAAFPSAFAGGALLLAVFGFYWDVATHIDNGRDPGPFANPSHYFIIFGLLGIAIAGYLGALLGAPEDSKLAIKVRDGWKIPLGCVLLMVCGLIAVAGFPLDDMWHRLFGQDVTLWGPTHIQMVGGAALSTLALWVLIVEGKRSLPADHRERGLAGSLEISLAGAFLLGLSALQAEFDYSVPQFRLLFQPIMLAMAASIALVPARSRLGRGGALKAVAFFLLVRGILTLVVGPGFGHTTLHFPLYIAEAILVELVASRVDPKNYISFGMYAGVAIGTLGVAAEWAWSQVWMTMSWTSSLFPEIGLALVAGVAGGVLGAMLARALDAPPRAEKSPVMLGVATGLALIACLAYPLPIGTRDASATVTLDSPGAPQTRATIVLDPPNLADGAEWFNVTAWQGGGSVVSPLERTGEGEYRTADPVPVHGEWKALIRLHTGSAIVALPIYLPADPAIPADKVPAEASVTRRFVSDKQILLREAKETPPWMSAAGNAALGLIVLIWIATLGWGLRRLEGDGVTDPGRSRYGTAKVRLGTR
ncbi:MAG: hypothetical protein QOG16_1362 [Actinomycetota bacterium]|jgi:hypothetical protein|nr:hypothetical protein [Actinomycetota bacterium]